MLLLALQLSVAGPASSRSSGFHAGIGVGGFALWIWMDDDMDGLELFGLQLVPSWMPAAQRLAAESPPMPPLRSAAVCFHFALSLPLSLSPSLSVCV